MSLHPLICGLHDRALAACIAAAPRCPTADHAAHGINYLLAVREALPCASLYHAQQLLLGPCTCPVCRHCTPSCSRTHPHHRPSRNHQHRPHRRRRRRCVRNLEAGQLVTPPPVTCHAPGSMQRARTMSEL